MTGTMDFHRWSITLPSYPKEKKKNGNRRQRGAESVIWHCMGSESRIEARALESDLEADAAVK